MPPKPSQESTHRQLFALALGWLEKGKLAAAEVVARRLLFEGFDDPALHNLLGRVAMSVSRADVAKREFARALEMNRGFKPAAKNLALAENALAQNPGTGTPHQPTGAADERFLLIRSWQQGFWADVDHVMGQLVLAEITGRTPITHWGHESRFSGDPTRDAWPSFFEPVSGRTIADVRGKGFDYYPPRWSDATLEDTHIAIWDPPEQRPAALHFLDRAERVCVSSMHASMECVTPWLHESHPWFGKGVLQVQREVVKKYVRPSAEARERVDAFAAKHLAGTPTVALHLRGSDKVVEDKNIFDLHIEALELAEKRRRELGESARLFLLTDSLQALDMARTRVGDKLVTTEAARTDANVGLHFQDAQDKKALGMEVLCDALLAARCDAFVGLGTSTVSASIRHLKDWAPGACTLVGTVMNDAPNIWLLLPKDR